MQATDTASAESAFLLSGTHHFRTHTNTLTHTQPALLAVTHSTAAGTSVRPLSQFRGRRSPHRPHTLLFSFVCLSACAASFPGVCVTPFVFHSTFFFPPVTLLLADLFFRLVTSERVAGTIEVSVKELLFCPVNSVQTL